MPLHVAVQMDPLDRINVAGDTTFALMLEAQHRRHSLFVYEPENLTWRAGTLVAKGRAVLVRDVKGDHYAAEPLETRALSDFDIVLMRQDPPFDMAYITATHLLEHAGPKTLVVNDPAAVRNAPEKLAALFYTRFMPPTLVTRDKEEAKAFRAAHKDVILKPLHGMGGGGVFRVRADDENFNAFVEMFSGQAREPFMMQAYLPAVRQGDKRIILVDGEIAGALNRIPADGDVRSNLVVGGRGEAAGITDREREICAALGPELKAQGLVLVGIDVIGGYLTEINVTSPTGVRAIKAVSGTDIPPMFWDAVEARRAAL